MASSMFAYDYGNRPNFAGPRNVIPNRKMTARRYYRSRVPYRPLNVKPSRPHSRTSVNERLVQQLARGGDVDISIPGVRNLFGRGSSWWRRLMWGTAILLCTSACFYQVSDRMILYFSKPVRIEVEVVRNETIKFPAFTVCPYDIDSMLAIRQVQYKYATISHNLSIESVWHLLHYANVTPHMIWQLNRVHTNNTFVNFALKKPMPIERFPHILFEPKLAYLGTCMSITIKEKVDFLGPAFILKVEQDVIDESIFDNNVAFTIYPHEDGAPAKHHAFFKGRIILRNYLTSIAVTMTTFKYIDSKDKPCTDAVVVATCWTNCLENVLTPRAKCRLPYMTTALDRKLSTCKVLEESNLTYAATLHMYLTTPVSKCNCPKKCNDVLYNMDLDVRDKMTNSTTVEIFFPNDSFQIIKEVYSYGFISLVCDVGGNLGLYLGFCLLTVLEIIEAIITKLHHVAEGVLPLHFR